MSPLHIPAIRGGKRGTVALADVGGGKNIKSSRFTLKPNEMVSLTNWYLAEDGSLIGRRGTTSLNTSLGANRIDGAGRGYFTANNQWLAMYQGTIYKSTNGTSFTSSSTGYTSGSPTWFVQYLTFVYASTQADAPKKYDGTTWTNMGIAVGAACTAADSGNAGTPNGTYTFEVTFVTPTAESNPSPASNSVTVTSHTINLTAIPVSADTNCTSRNIYGFKNTASTIYLLVGTIADNTTTTFTVTTDFASWTTAVPITNNPWPTGPWIKVLWQNRLWGGGDPAHLQRVYFSQIFLPEYQPTAFFFDIPFANNDAITAIFPLGQLLLVCSNNQVAYIYGATPYTFTVQMSFCQSGTPSAWAIDIYQNAAVRISRYGVYAFDGSQDTALTDPIEPAFSGILPDIPSMNFSSAFRAALAYYDRVKAFLVTWPTASGSSQPNDTTYWYFIRKPGWVQDSRTAALFLVDNGTGGNGNLYAWQAAAGVFQQWDVNNTYTDDGVAIQGSWATGVLLGDNPLTTKRWTWFILRASPGTFSVALSGQVDQGAETDTFMLNLAVGATYGTGQYGTAQYATDLGDFDERWAPNMVGRGLSVSGGVSFSGFIRIAQMYQQYVDTGIVRHIGATP